MSRRHHPAISVDEHGRAVTENARTASGSHDGGGAVLPLARSPEKAVNVRSSVHFAGSQFLASVATRRGAASSLVRAGLGSRAWSTRCSGAPPAQSAWNVPARSTRAYVCEPKQSRNPWMSAARSGNIPEMVLELAESMGADEDPGPAGHGRNVEQRFGLAGLPRDAYLVVVHMASVASAGSCKPAGVPSREQPDLPRCARSCR
jgi:hypothetical protein